MRAHELPLYRRPVDRARRWQRLRGETFSARDLGDRRGQLSVPPDIAQVDAGVATDAKTAREASEANNAAMAKVLLALKAAEIEPGTSRPRGCRCSRNTRRTARGRRRSSAIAPAIASPCAFATSARSPASSTRWSAPAPTTSAISLFGAQASKLLDDAREKAVADARRKAEIYAKAAGVTLGAPLSISEGGAPQPMFRAKMGGAWRSRRPRSRRAKRRCRSRSA